MTADLLGTIDQIVIYGVYSNLPHEEDKLARLENNLIKLYLMHFDVPNISDEKEYPEFDRSMPELRKNIESNFPELGLYQEALNMTDFVNYGDMGVGDAIDDLHDIIKDLLEVKWRIENNSQLNGLRYFQFLFIYHMKQHTIGLLNYIEHLKVGDSYVPPDEVDPKRPWWYFSWLTKYLS